MASTRRPVKRAPGWRNLAACRTIPPPMSVLAFLLAAQTAVPADTVPPYLAFPEAGLDDPAAYQGYATRLYRDANGNALQGYLNSRTRRGVHLLAGAARERGGLPARGSAGAAAAP